MIFTNNLMKGLIRIRVFDKSGSEHGTSAWCDHWLLEDGEKEFWVLSRHRVRGLEIDQLSKEEYVWETKSIN